MMTGNIMQHVTMLNVTGMPDTMLTSGMARRPRHAGEQETTSSGTHNA